ncbi:MAG: glycosyltransferase family 1 protein [Patescibacteria group bacterium]
MDTDFITIGIDARSITAPYPAGPEKYLTNLIRNLSKVDHRNKYFLYVSEKADGAFVKALLNNNSNFKLIFVGNFPLNTQLALGFSLIKNPVDVFFSSVHTLPLITLLRRKTKIILMVHGIDNRYAPYYSNIPKRLIISLLLKMSIRCANKVIAPSSHSKKQILTFSHILEGKIEVIHEGLDEEKTLPNTNSLNTLHKLKLAAKWYFLCVSTIQPRKNIQTILAAFENFLIQTGIQDFKLVLVGKNGWGYGKLLKTIRQSTAGKSIVLAGRVQDYELAELYKNAKAFISASFDEGFGLPAIEASQFRCPLILSNIETYQELLEDSADFFDPTDTKQLTALLIKHTLTNPPDSHIEQAYEKTKELTFANTAKKTLAVFENSFKNL